MPSLEEVPENGSLYSNSNSRWDRQWKNKCSCCPYGFHIDVEFVQFSQSLLSRPGDVRRLEALKDKWRSERQSMDQLLGSNGAESKRNSLIEKQQIWSYKTAPSNGLFSQLAEQVHELSSIQDDEPFDAGLEAAEAEFDLALNRVQTSHKGLSFEVNDKNKFHTFPRIKVSSGRKAVTESPIIPKRDLIRKSSPREPFEFTGESSEVSMTVKERGKLFERENGGPAPDVCALKELRELQEKVKALTRENWKLKCEKLATKDLTEQEKFVRKTINRLEINEDEPDSPKLGVKPRTRDVYVEAVPRTREVGVSKKLPLTRSIGVGGVGINDSIYMERGRREEPASPTGSISGTLRRRVRTFDVGVQINECDLHDDRSTPILQIIEKLDIGIQTVSEDSSERKRFKDVGSLAKTLTYDIGVAAKPDVHNALCGIETSTISVKVQTDSEPEGPEPEPQTPDFHIKKIPLVHVQLESPDSTEPENISTTFAGGTVESCEPQKELKEDGTDDSATDIYKPKPKVKVSKALFELEKYPVSSEPTPKPASRIPRLSPSLRSPTKQEQEWETEQQASRGDTPSPAPRPTLVRSDTFTKEIEEEKPPTPTPRRQKAVPSKEMQGALKVLNDALLRGRTTSNVTSAISIILHEWFRVSGTKTANPHDVEDYLDNFENYSPQILRYIVNMPDGNGNTAMHYAVSHGNFDVVSILLDSRVCDPNKANKAGYTSVMLVALAKVVSDTHRHIVRRLFSMGDVNTKAAQHGQTALMLASSHGRLDTVKLLLEAGAEINLQDEDGSTALMCASEHGHSEIVKYLLSTPDCDPNITDNDGSTALTVAMEAGNKDIGVMLYAHMNFPDSPTDSSPRRIRSEEAEASA